MQSTPPVEKESEDSSLDIHFFLMILLAMMIGLLAAILLLPSWLPSMATSLTGASPKAYWYLSRATAFVSLSILWISMALGIGISNKMARLWPGAPAAFAVHEYVSLLGLAFALFHALVLLGDHYINFTAAQIFMPFATVGYRPLWVGIGQIGFYVWLIVNVSFYIRRSIGQKTWRAIHYLSFAMYLMGLVHGLFSGTDSHATWAQSYYWISGGSLLFLLVYRIINSVAEKLARRPKHGSQIQHSTVSLGDKTITSATRLSSSSQITSKKQLPGSLNQQIPLTGTRPQSMANSASGASAAPVSEIMAPSSASVLKLEHISDGNKINVRIFKEPTTKSPIP